MVFVPCRVHTRDKSTWCRWCVQFKAKSALFKVRDGPIDWYFCDEEHAELWITYRHKRATYRLCRMLPADRLAHLQGRSMEDEISRLEALDEVTADSGSSASVRAVPNSQVSVSQDA